jgi:phage terminase large subunit-like protein
MFAQKGLLMSGLQSIEPWPPRWLTPVPEDVLLSGDGAHVIEFAESFGIITKDSVAGLSGEQLVLRAWQKELLLNVFAGQGGLFRHSVSLVGVPRKNGKSALGSVLCLFSLLNGARGGEVYSVAAEKEQARIVFADAKRTIESSPELSEVVKLYRDAIEYPERGSVYRVLSAEAYSKEGLNPNFVLFDELHAQPNRELFDVMSLAMGSRGSLASLVAITTAGVKTDSKGQDSIAYALYNYGREQIRLEDAGEPFDETFFMAWWEDDGDHRNPETWARANPGFGDLNSPEDFESAVKRTPESAFRTKRTNQWVSSALSWLPTGSWEELQGDSTITPDDEIILGFDGSFSGDCTVIVAATVPKDDEPIRLQLVKVWEKNVDEDGDDWRVDIADVENTIIDYCQKHPKVREVACDPFRWQRSMMVLEEKGLPIVEYPSTSPRRMVASCAKFYDMVMDKQLVHSGDPVLSRHLQNAIVKSDNIGPRIVKESRNSPRKIDAAVAAVIAVDRATVGRIEPVVPQFFG